MLVTGECLQAATWLKNCVCKFLNQILVKPLIVHFHFTVLSASIWEVRRPYYVRFYLDVSRLDIDVAYMEPGRHSVMAREGYVKGIPFEQHLRLRDLAVDDDMILRSIPPDLGN